MQPFNVAESLEDGQAKTISEILLRAFRLDQLSAIPLVTLPSRCKTLELSSYSSADNTHPERALGSPSKWLRASRPAQE
jgi:hypothetical protein